KTKEDAIRILESCGFYARIGLKVLEQRSLITISPQYNGFDACNYEVLGMHDHIEEMGKNIIRCEHLDEPSKHKWLWIKEEIEDILVNDKGTEATRCIKLDTRRGNSQIVMKGLGNIKKLQYLEVLFPDYDSSPPLDGPTQYFPNAFKYLKFWNYHFHKSSELDIPNSLIYLKCEDYPFLYLLKTFQANNLVGLEMMESTRMVQLKKKGEKRVTPNLETLSLKFSYKLKELCMPVSCQKLTYLHISASELISFNLGLIPNLETLSLIDCTHFVKLEVSVACPNLKFLQLSNSRLRSFDLELIPNLETLSLENSSEFVKLEVFVACPNLKYLNLSKSRLRSLDSSFQILRG
ncbi:disease resistance TIR-NBS-LRR class family protein, partial [Tanacetum coccineum]